MVRPFQPHAEVFQGGVHACWPPQSLVLGKRRLQVQVAGGKRILDPMVSAVLLQLPPIVIAPGAEESVGDSVGPFAKAAECFREWGSGVDIRLADRQDTRWSAYRLSILRFGGSLPAAKNTVAMAATRHPQQERRRQCRASNADRGLDDAPSNG